MQTISTASTTSGNRRSGDNQDGVAGSAVGETQSGRSPLEPKASNQALRYSGVQPIRQMPNIGDVIMRSQNLVQNKLQSNLLQTAPDEEAQDNPDIKNEDCNDVAEAQSDPVAEESFADCWVETVDALFSKKPAFYHQLKDYQPIFNNGVITVDVENEFQKKQLEAISRTIITFWNEKYNSKISEIEFVIKEHEKKKMIYTSEDKVRNMLEQNPELKNFLQILNFRVKD